MATITGITKKTENPFVNLYELDRNQNRKRRKILCCVKSKSEKDLKLVTGKNEPDGVVIYSLYGEQQDKVVLIRQYRYAINDFVYEFPAGLVEKQEPYKEAAVREMKEETGWSLRLLQ